MPYISAKKLLTSKLNCAIIPYHQSKEKAKWNVISIQIHISPFSTFTLEHQSKSDWCCTKRVNDLIHTTPVALSPRGIFVTSAELTHSFRHNAIFAFGESVYGTKR